MMQRTSIPVDSISVSSSLASVNSSADYRLICLASGVASGDPYDTSILLWTRAVPTNDAPEDVPVCLTYSVMDASTNSTVSSGYALGSYEVDFTFKVEAKGLSASTEYTYQWANCANPDEHSPVGKTRTAPGKYATQVPTQSFAIYSCSNYPNGFFNSYGGPVYNEDAMYAVHVGDYIYESGSGGSAIGRTPSNGKELSTLRSYRDRYLQYRTDPDLYAAHQNLPWIVIWDDHETANNDWKGGSQDSNDSYATGGCNYGGQNGICFTERAANAKRAYHEYLPIRQVDTTNEWRIWRDFRFGDLVDIMALDTRKYDRDITDLSYNTEYVESLAVQLNSTRSITGPEQESWLLQRLDESMARNTHWRMVLNQVIFGSVNYSSTSADGSFQINTDSWDGYQRSRLNVMQHVYDNAINNTVIYTGDTHANWLLENNLDTVLKGTLASNTLKQRSVQQAEYVRGQLVEYGGTAVSSSGWGSSFGNEPNATAMGATGLVRDNGGLLWAEGYYRGYMSVEVSYDNITTSYYAYPTNQQQRNNTRLLSARFVQKPGTNSVERPIKSVFGAVKEGN